MAELRAGVLVRQSRLPGCQIPELRSLPVRVIRHDRGVSLIAPAADGGVPVHVADGVGEEFTTLPTSPASDLQPGQYHVLQDGTTVLVGAEYRSDLGTVRRVHRLPWRATAWEEVPVPERYVVLGATSTPEEPLVLSGGRLQTTGRSGEPYPVPVLVTPAPTGGGWSELDFTGWGRPSVGWRDRLGRPLVDPRTGALAAATGAGDLWCMATEFGEWWEHILLYAADSADQSWSFIRLPLDELAGCPSVAADGVTAVSAKGRLLNYVRGTGRWTSSDLSPVLRGLHPGAADGVTVTDMVVAGDRLVLVVDLSAGGPPEGKVVCSLPLDGRSAELIFEAADPDCSVRALTV
ncbi:hypothetical protein [Kitasatospora sp. NE20-6]|uniref:hypothetical protein n=1 Tax=Kitasatospora sp. NE20-6 TaxID=2859066 RepID=UPI0038B2D00A